MPALVAKPSYYVHVMLDYVTYAHLPIPYTSIISKSIVVHNIAMY